MKTTLLSLTTFLLLAFGIHQSNDALETNATVTDIDGNTYKTVTISEQTWMAENLNVSKFKNGDIIPEAKSKKEWTKACQKNQPIWCYYKFDSENGKKYGKFYNWFAVNDKRGLAPENWAIPSNDDWKILFKSIGGFENFSIQSEVKNFNVLYSGYAVSNKSNNMFYSLGKSAYWWTSTPSSLTPDRTSFGWLFDLNSNKFQQTNLSNSDTGLSIRCIKNK
jgi:uncharacterized protein (TIGR02145 family)